MMEYDLSLVISVYNEEQVLDKFYSAFADISRRFEWTYELIFVDDGSIDRSLDILKKFAADNKSVRIVSFSRNFGHEAAMIAGIDYARGEHIICMDADLQHPLESIFPIMEKFREGYDVISMVRVSNVSAGIIKNITSKAFYKIANKLSDQLHLEENASDFFAVSRRAADVLRNNYRERVRFIRGYVQSVGFRRTTLEYTAAERAAGASHYSIRKLMRLSINTIVNFSNAPLKLGIAAGILSLIGAIVMLICTLCATGYARETDTVITVMLFLFAVLFLIVGMIGEYLAIILSEIKNRPIYIVEETINENPSV
jgi:polyisoprenyl-phosphate glycosyltransferase